MYGDLTLIVNCNLELIEGDNLENYFRSMRLPPPKAKSSGSDRELPSIASGKLKIISSHGSPDRSADHGTDRRTLFNIFIQVVNQNMSNQMLVAMDAHITVDCVVVATTK